ncbi:MAG TPA: hypothetical protein VJR71_05855 [Pseudolabrys sp.]|nr:hypothetical protein [Pseudolabrys sp.]
MRIVRVALAFGLFMALAGSASAADMPVERGHVVHRHHHYRAGGYDVRMRVVEQVPYCGDCDNLLGHAHSPYVRLREVGRPFWEQGCALGGCNSYYRAIQRCWGWSLEAVCEYY